MFLLGAIALAAAEDRMPFPTCGAPDPAVAELVDYSLLAVDGRYVAQVEPPDWQPARTPRMPHHHASRVAWTNLADFPALALAAAGLRFTFVFEGRDIVQVQPRQWRATYRARIEAICSPPPSPSPQR